MVTFLKNKIYQLLKKSEKWTKTDMIYLAKGGIWLTLNKISGAISAFALSIAFANFLPTEVYGTYKFILSLASLLTIPTLTSISTSITQAVSRGFEGSIKEAVKTKVKWGLLGSLSSIILAYYYYINNDPNLAIAFLLISLFIPFRNAFALYNSFYIGKKRFKTLAKYNLIKNVFSTVFLISALFLSNNIYVIIFSFFFPQILINIVLYLATIKKNKLNTKKDPKTISYGIYLSLISVLSVISNNIDKLLLWHYLGATQLAIYTFAVAPIGQLSSFIGGYLPILAMPKLSNGPIDEIKKTLPKKTIKLILLTIPIIIFYIFSAPYVYDIFFPKYLDSIIYSQIFSISIIIGILQIFQTALVSKMKKKEMGFIVTFIPIVRIILYLIFIPLYGILGLILSQLFAGFLKRALEFFLFLNMKNE